MPALGGARLVLEGVEKWGASGWTRPGRGQLLTISAMLQLCLSAPEQELLGRMLCESN